MTVKWTPDDVLKAMNEALTPSQNGNGKVKLLDQLKSQAKAITPRPAEGK